LRRNSENDSYVVAQDNMPALMNGEITAEELTQSVQDRMDIWYTPGMFSQP
jgi:hypothetical protein